MTREDREDAIDIIQSILDKYEEDECLVTEITIGDEDIKAFKMAIKALEQETFINKPCCISGEVCEHDKNVVLDKLRAEIEQTSETVDGFLMHNGTKRTVLKIIDKYKADRSVKE